MGSCVCIQSKKLIVDNTNKKENSLRFEIKKLYVESCLAKKCNQNYFNKITKKNWIRILNFLKFKELKEASKVNSVLCSLAKSQKILKKFFRSRNEKYKMSILPSPSKFNSSYTNVLPKNKNFLCKSDISTFSEIKKNNAESDEVNSFFEKFVDQQSKGSIFSSRSDLEESKIERDLNDLDHNSENRIKILNSHNITIYSVPSDNMTPSFALESGIDSFIDKSSKHSNKNLFRTFGSHNTKISQISQNFSECQSDIQIFNLKDMKGKNSNHELSSRMEMDKLSLAFSHIK